MNALMIVGSPKSGNSVSEKIGNYVFDRLKGKGFACQTLTASKTNRQELVEKAKNADMILIAFPLYIDSLPAPLIKALEIISNSATGMKKIAVICNSGFPEPKQCLTALDIVKTFAKESGSSWIGGIAVGGGASLASRKPKKLEDHGGMARKLIKSLDLLTKAIVEDKPFETHLLTAAQPLPAWVYGLLGNAGWKGAAKRRGLQKRDLYAKPFDVSDYI